MKFRLISKSADGLGIAFRLSSEGNKTDFWLKDPKAKNLYSGVLVRVKDWHDGLNRDIIPIIDMVGFGKIADKLRGQGYKVPFGSELADKLELERGFGLDIAGDCGIEVPYSEDFQDFEKAIKLVEKKGTAFVFKPEHNKEGVETYVSSDADDMIAMLEYFEQVWQGKIDFILQEVIDGEEVSSEAWYINGDLVPNSYNNTWETKRFLDNDLSKNTGCMSSMVKFNACPKLYTETLKKLEPFLKKNKYTGPLDINCMITDKKVYMLEWTARMGYSAIYALCEGLNMELGSFIEAFANGKDPNLKPSDNWLGSLRITIPPYPHVDEAPDIEGIPIRGIESFDHIWPLDVMMRDDKLVCSGYDGIICEVTGNSKTIDGLWNEIYGIAGITLCDGLLIPDKQMRLDMASNAKERINRVRQLGYLKG
jgi:phosphoribosylamine-glycine ligase